MQSCARKPNILGLQTFFHFSERRAGTFMEISVLQENYRLESCCLCLSNRNTVDLKSSNSEKHKLKLLIPLFALKRLSDEQGFLPCGLVRELSAAGKYKCLWYRASCEILAVCNREFAMSYSKSLAHVGTPTKHLD